MAEETQNEDGVAKLSARMDKLEEKMNKMDEAIANMGKKTNAHAEVIDAINADREAERAALVNKAVEAKILSEDDAKATPMAALKALVNASAEKVTPAPGINPGYSNSGKGDNIAQFSPLGDVKEA